MNPATLISFLPPQNQMIQKWVKPILPTPAICLTALLILVFTSTGLASNGLYEPCADTRVQRSDGFTLGIAFSSRPSFFIDQSHQLSPCDRRLSLASLNSQLAIFRPKVDEISLLTVNTSTFFPVLSLVYNSYPFFCSLILLIYCSYLKLFTGFIFWKFWSFLFSSASAINGSGY